jgi:hypothetical protein
MVRKIKDEKKGIQGRVRKKKLYLVNADKHSGRNRSANKSDVIQNKDGRKCRRILE